MKHHSAIGMYFLIAVSVVTLNVAAERVAASEPLPDASVLAYRSTPRQPKPPTPPKISEVTLTGVVNDVAPKGLTIKAGKTSASKDQKQWLVFAQSDSTEFTIRGTATLDYLRKGQTIEFGAQIAADEKVAKKADEEKVADKLDMLTIVSRKGGLAQPQKWRCQGPCCRSRRRSHRIPQEGRFGPNPGDARSVRPQGRKRRQGGGQARGCGWRPEGEYRRHDRLVG